MNSEIILRRIQCRCPICDALADSIGEKIGRWRPRPYHLARCSTCALSFVTDPDTDFAAIYDADYYRGNGADPLIDYEGEVETPNASPREYELRGLTRYAKSLRSIEAGDRWLDFGCGMGGFVAYLRAQQIDAFGYDEGYGALQAQRRGLPVLANEELEALAGTFAVVSAIEVLEHVLDPLDTIRRISRLLRPGGIFLYTTGNAEPFRGRLSQWSYVVPEIHVSFYEPQTMRILFSQADLIPLQPVRRAVLADVIRYKIMKTLRLRRRGLVDRILPWPILTSVADRRFQISSMIASKKATAS